MIEQSPKDRIRNFKEVPKGYTSEIALLESYRCLQCGKSLCVTGCPVNVDIPGFIRLIRKEKFREAAQKILETNSLPAVCGRVCPQESQCEGVCLLGRRFKPIAIGNLERFLADFERNHRSFFVQKKKAQTGKKVAVLGCGPASLTAAGDLIKLGYDVTIYEAFHKGGGVLAYGIPEFRLPKSIVDSEIEYIKSLGVKIEYNVIIGKTLTFEDLRAMGYEAIFIGIGAGLPSFLGIPGENLKGIISANEYLTRTNLMKAYRFPEYHTPIKIGNKVIVIGGGNVTLDSARTALRLGAEKVIVVYRRSEAEMPARKEEYHHAIEEGIEFQFLTNPIRFIGDVEDNIKQIEVIKMKLGEPDESGRKRPIPIEGSEYLIDADTVIIAIGTKANSLFTKTIPELKLTKRGYIETDENGQTNLEGIFAGGDIVTGNATVISAMGAGKRAAKAIDQYLKEKYLNKKNR
ncbi:MAG: NADPH-dependent glutamate synthase [Promethearchaeota archaeon]